MTTPRVAICVPAHGSAPGLQRLLKSIEAVDYPHDALRVIVAIDGPDAELEKVARSHADEVVVSPVNRGSYAMRNLAIDRVGDASFVLFTDSDCVVTPGWVTAHVAALASSEMSGGPVRFSYDDSPTPAEWVDSQQCLRQDHFILRIGFAATANLAVRREVLDVVRFDDSLRSGGDWDFGRRAGEAGFRLAYTADAAIVHPARNTARAVLKKTWRVAGGARVLSRRGHAASRRHDPVKGRAAVAARAQGLPVSRLWLARTALLDYTCSLLYAVRVPEVIGPKLRRVLMGR
ncbi:MAG TPA: glycosyltransferase [Mycobacteriales bacterium]|nr:glycosyltransferase [Mycobacteriales bacterium]